MKHLKALLYATLIGFSGCFLFEPFGGLDAVMNSTSAPWSVSVAFTDGKSRTFQIPPEIYTPFSRMAKREPMPLLATITTRAGAGEVYSLTRVDVEALRKAANGKVRLILYEDGIACMPPGWIAPDSENRKYFEWLRTNKHEWLKWTKEVLAQTGRG